MGVNPEGDSRVLVAETLRYVIDWHSSGQQQSGARMPKPVETDALHLSELDQLVELMLADIARSDRPAEFAREHKACLCPCGTPCPFEVSLRIMPPNVSMFALLPLLVLLIVYITPTKCNKKL